MHVNETKFRIVLSKQGKLLYIFFNIVRENLKREFFAGEGI